MRSGRRSKKLPLKPLAFAFGLLLFFIYANVTADTKTHSAEVTILPDKEMLASLVKDISSAKESIYIAMYMFKSYRNEKSGAGLIKASLIKAAGRGVKVYAAMEQSDESDFVDKENKKLGKELAKYNIKVVYDNPEQRMHTKCIVIDGTITYLGSHNYTNSALKYNRELTARIVSEGAAAEAIEHIRSIK